ncbi:MAG: amino acid ABC transporter permease [Oscillospiraceae bacterium]|nr:amino acid ABC transporter permease [Oscillospiraceae bacterium]
MEFWTEFVDKLSLAFSNLWTSFDAQFNQAFVVGDRWKLYIEGLGTTLLVTVLALILGIILGVLVAVVRSAHDQQGPGKTGFGLSFLNWICKLYVTVIRGTPMMVQLLIMYLVIFASSRNQVGVAMLAFGINSGAYASEIIRGGIMAMDPGQMEAGRSLGFSYASTMRIIIIPQVVKMILPALGNELITLLKETSIVTVIGLRDITKVALLIQGKTYQALFPLIAIALVYLALVLVLTWIFGRLERRLRTNER